MRKTAIPGMMLGRKLKEQLAVIPDYSDDIRALEPAERLIKLQDIYQLYIPSQMSEEIYCKLYMALLHSMRKKESPLAVRQKNENFRAIRQMNYQGIIGGSDSFTIIGESGIGKSTAISRAITIIEDQARIGDVIPFVVVQCPFDSSPKNLLLEILRVVDETIGTQYCENAKRAKATTDMLIGSVSQIAISRIAVMILDEVQNMVNSKNGKVLVGMLTQLINNSGISICMVGTPPCTVFFEAEMQLARRSVGLSYKTMEYGEDFCNICRMVWEYQYVQEVIPLNEDVLCWLYEHSRGNISILLSLVHDAQEIAILSGEDALTVGTLTQAFEQRLTLLHDFITQRPGKVLQTKKKTNSARHLTMEEDTPAPETSLSELFDTVKKSPETFVDLLKETDVIEEVPT